MPRGDRRGPSGFGPMTGRRVGYCAGYPAPGFANPCPGRGGRGYRWMYKATGAPGWAQGPYAQWGYGAPGYMAEPDEVSEKEMLKGEAMMLKEQLAQIEKRLKKVEEEEKEEE